MAALIERIASQGGATREALRKAVAKSKPGRPKAFIFNYRPQNKAFNLKLSFARGKAEREDVIAALESILQELREA